MKKRVIQLVFLMLLVASSGAGHAQDVISVSAKPLAELMVEQRQYAPATVKPLNRAIVAAQISAQIEKIKVQAGDLVNKDQLLAQLNKRDYELALDQARAALASTDAQIEQAQQRLNRALELSTSNYISADDLLARQTDVTVFTANRASQVVAINVAKNNLSKTRIVAPFDAVVVQRQAQVGSFGAPGTPLFELVQIEGREIEASVGSDLIDALQKGIQLRFERNKDFWPATLHRVSPVVQSESGTQIVRLKFSDKQAAIGSSGRLSWANQAGLLPASMMVTREKQLGIFIAEGGNARFFPISNAQEGRPANIDLPGDTMVVTQGRFKLQDGTNIKLITKQ